MFELCNYDDLNLVVVRDWKIRGVLMVAWADMEAANETQRIDMHITAAAKNGLKN